MNVNFTILKTNMVNQIPVKVKATERRYGDIFIFYRSPVNDDIIFDEANSRFEKSHYYGFDAFIEAMKPDVADFL